MGSLILDEWLWSDLLGDNGTEKQRESLGFITAVYRKCDRLVTARESKFMTKGWALLKCSDATRRDIARFVKLNFLINSLKLKTIPPDELSALADNLQKMVKPGDAYLLQVYLAEPGSAIITTDNPLRNALMKSNISCEDRDVFVPSYISKYGK